MEDEDEVDVEGDFDINIGTDHETLPNLYIDINEPPSKSANLLPEYTQHPWMLEQGWTLQLDHAADEKSKAAIEKMLLEEQQYMNGKVTMAKVSTGTHSSSGRLHKPIQVKKAWTEEEKVTFLKGLEIYGRSWSKIADLIPGKSVQQVKSFGQHYFKMKAKEEEDLQKKDVKMTGTVKTQLPIGIQNAIRAVTTAQPTVKVSPKKLSTYYSNASSMWTEPEPSKNPLPKPQPSPSKPKKEHPPRKQSTKRKTEKIKNEKRKNEEKSKRGCKMKSPGSKRKEKNRMVGPGVTVEAGVAESFDNKTEDKMALNVLIDGSEVVRIPSKEDNDSCDSDVEIDIDVDSDEDVNVSSEPGHREMDTVYQRLVESAGIQNTDAINDWDLDGDSSDYDSCPGTEQDNPEDPAEVQIKTEVLEEVYDQDLFAQGDVLPDLKEEVCNVKMEANIDIAEGDMDSVDTTKNLERYPSIGSIFESQTESLSDEETVKTEPGSTSEQDIITGGLEDVEKVKLEPASPPMVKVELEEEKGESEVEKEKDERLVERDDGDSLDSVEGDYDDDEEEEHSNEYGILTSLGEVVYLPNPSEEAILARDFITDLERKIHCEFFTQKAGAKTPDRYLKIRNFILDAWIKSRPQYLNKTSVRPGLKNCGDVNCIGRIHSYLEQAGAINFGCSQVQYRRLVRSVQPKVKGMKENESTSRTESIRVRKRRVRDVGGDWVDERDLEGKTIEHKEVVEKKAKVGRRSYYDPFKLIPCQNFTMRQPAPYSLVIDSRAMVIMDIHSHMCKTEVIGLLGGMPGAGILNVTMAVPCESLSTGMQCEMDPVSQTEACDVIEREGQQVVGWYHSHPSFTPNPSCRDIETQEKYQDWFGKGGNPFVGVIVSPYCHGNDGAISTVRCLMVLKDQQTPPNYGVPHQFDYKVVHERWEEELVLVQVSQLAERYSKFINRVHLLNRYSSRPQITFLEKMITSATSNIPESYEQDKGVLVAMINGAILTAYTADSDKKEYKILDSEVRASDERFDLTDQYIIEAASLVNCKSEHEAESTEGSIMSYVNDHYDEIIPHKMDSDSQESFKVVSCDDSEQPGTSENHHQVNLLSENFIKAEPDVNVCHSLSSERNSNKRDNEICERLEGGLLGSQEES